MSFTLFFQLLIRNMAFAVITAGRYQPGARQYIKNFPPIEYAPDDQARKVQHKGWVSYKGREYRIPKAFCGQRVAVRPTKDDGFCGVYYCNQKIAQLNVKEQRKCKSVTYVSECV